MYVVRLAHHCGGGLDLVAVMVAQRWHRIGRSAAGRHKIGVWNEELNSAEFRFESQNAYVAASREQKLRRV